MAGTGDFVKGFAYGAIAEVILFVVVGGVFTHLLKGVPTGSFYGRGGTRRY